MIVIILCESMLKSVAVANHTQFEALVIDNYVQNLIWSGNLDAHEAVRNDRRFLFTMAMDSFCRTCVIPDLF